MSQKGYSVYFTDEKGHEELKKMDGQRITHKDLPTPLLKQIK